MQMSLTGPTLAAVTFAVLASAETAAFGEVISYKADLKASAEVPPIESAGTGSVAAVYDTASKKLTWTIPYAGLTGPAIAAHFHGPASTSAIAPPVVPITGNLTSPIKGEATLTDAQAADLGSGLWYFNIHTDAHKPGEIRGQLTKQ